MPFWYVHLIFDDGLHVIHPRVKARTGYTAAKQVKSRIKRSGGYPRVVGVNTRKVKVA